MKQITHIKQMARRAAQWPIVNGALCIALLASCQQEETPFEQGIRSIN